jgi:hypothetical protein
MNKMQDDDSIAAMTTQMTGTTTQLLDTLFE